MGKMVVFEQNDCFLSCFSFLERYLKSSFKVIVCPSFSSSIGSGKKEGSYQRI